MTYGVIWGLAPLGLQKEYNLITVTTRSELWKSELCEFVF